MAGQGNVWTWPDPVRGDSAFTSPAYDVWENTYTPEDKWYDNWNQYQKYQSNQSTWRDYNLGGQYNNNLYAFSQKSYDPYTQVRGYAPQSGLTYARIINDIQSWIDREHPELSDFDTSSGMYGQGANSTANLGGEWANFDRYNADILKAQQQVQKDTGVFVPGNVIKSIMRIEAPSGDPGEGPAYGLMQVTGGAMGQYDLMRARTDAGYGIWAGVNELALRYKDALAQNNSYGWNNVAVGYFSGHYVPNGAYDGFSTDYQYMDRFSGYLSQLDAAVRGGTPGGYTGGQVQSSTDIINIAKQYLGTQYVWGAIPGKGQDPRITGWDCSGMIYWLDQNYGTGAIPMGSHYQYQYAQQTGQLFTNTTSLRPGDLVFFDTGDRSGGGAELNGASHVGIYIGVGANGQMQMLHAANPGQGTIISNFSDYQSMYIGGMHASWSGGVSGYGSGVSAMDAVTGGVPYPVTQEFGPTSWSEGEGAYMYGYASDYGVTGHPGLDVGVPLNTALYSPVSGTVMIAGGTPYFADDRYGATPGTGELMIQLDNGEQIILGHMSNITVKVGDRVSPMQAVGNSGTANGAHVHIEWRVPGANTPSGYQIIDPRLRLGGTVSGQFGPGTTSPYRASANNWSAFMRAISRGEPVTGYSGSQASSSFHNWMRQGMQNQWNTATIGAPPGGPSTIAAAWGIAPSQIYNNVLKQATEIPKVT